MGTVRLRTAGRVRQLLPYRALSVKLIEAEFHAIVGNPRLDTALAAEAPDKRAEHPPVATDDLRAAMRKGRARHRLRTAPVELGADRRVTNADCTSPADYRPGHRCAVADIKLDSAQCRLRIADRDNVRYIECASPVGGNA